MNAPAQSCATSFLRPVYLCPREPLEVRLGPGPSLELHHGRHAPGLLPLARLARILANRHVRWQTEALYACLEHGIPIVFVDRDRVLGWSFGEDARRYRLDELLEFALDRDDWEHVLGDFFRAHQRRAMIAAARALGVLADRFEPEHLRGLLANRLRDRLGRPVGSLLRQAELAISSLVVGLLAAQVRQARLLAHDRPSWNLPREITATLAWELFPLLRTRPAASASPADERAWILREIESPSSAIRASAHRLLRDFEHHLTRMLL